MTERSIAHLDEETQAYIRELRTESGRHRNERNEARAERDRLTEKYTEAGELLKQANEKVGQFQTLEGTVEETAKANEALKLQRDKELAAWKAGLLPEDVDRIKGDTAEDWEKDATELASRLGRKAPGIPTDPAAGAGTGDGGTKDPITEAFREAGFQL